MPLTNRLLLAKYLYTRGFDVLREGGIFDPGLAVSLFQDAVEIALLACGASVHASPKDKSGFELLWDETNKALMAANKAPLRMKIDMISLNKARVNFKHVGQIPDARVAETCRINAGEFLIWAAREYFDQDFWSLSLISFVTDVDEQRLLQAALERLGANDARGALQACSDALSHVGERRQGFYRHGILVQYGGIDPKIREYINNEVVELRKQIWDVDAIAFAQACGVSSADFLVVRQILPHRIGTEWEFPCPLEVLSIDTARRCIEFVTQYSIGLSQRLRSPEKFLGGSAWVL